MKTYTMNNEKKAIKEIPAEELIAVTGGGNCGWTPEMTELEKNCPSVQSTGYHKFRETGRSRPSKAWLYKTDEEYVCECCGLAFWSAGFWSWDYFRSDYHILDV